MQFIVASVQLKIMLQKMIDKTFAVQAARPLCWQESTKWNQTLVPVEKTANVKCNKLVGQWPNKSNDLSTFDSKSVM